MTKQSKLNKKNRNSRQTNSSNKLNKTNWLLINEIRQYKYKLKVIKGKKVIIREAKQM